jgi:hypothetical protein
MTKHLKLNSIDGEQPHEPCEQPNWLELEYDTISLGWLSKREYASMIVNQMVTMVHNCDSKTRLSSDIVMVLKQLKKIK